MSTEAQGLAGEALVGSTGIAGLGIAGEALTALVAAEIGATGIAGEALVGSPLAGLATLGIAGEALIGFLEDDMFEVLILGPSTQVLYHPVNGASQYVGGAPAAVSGNPPEPLDTMLAFALADNWVPMNAFAEDSVFLTRAI